MAHAKRKKSQLPSQEDETFQHTTVATPEIEVSLVDRMRKRFSTRNPSKTSEARTDAEAETTSETTSSQNQTTSKSRKSQRKTSKRSSLGQKVTQIDKFFSPDVRSNRVFRSPTRFPSTGQSQATAATASSGSDEGFDETGVRTKHRKTTGDTQRDIQNSGSDDRGRTHSSADNLTDDAPDNSRDTTLKRKKEGQATGVFKKKRSVSSSNKSTTGEGVDVGGEPDGGRSNEDTAGSSQESQAQGGSPSTRKEQGAKRKGSAVLASGEVEAHMADKEFISNQVRVISTPFILESGPRNWMQIWKGQQSSHEDPPDIPASVLDRIVSKINFHMEDVYQHCLGRQQQRNTLMSLDEQRKDAKEQSQSTLQAGLRSQASLQEIISCYPSEWPGSVEEGDEEMAERYAALRARLFALSRSLSITKRQCSQYKSLAETLQGINTNSEKCSSADFDKEIKRTANLVSEILKKLQSGTQGEKQTVSQGENINTEDNSELTTSSRLTNHAALVRSLFKTAAMTESP